MNLPNRSDVLSKERRHDGFYKVDLLTVRHQSFAGTISTPVAREVIRRGEIVVIVPYDPVRDVIVLTKQWRVGAIAAKDLPHCPDGTTPWVLETPAGYVAPGELPLDAARREVVEETGFEPKRMEQIGQILTNPGMSDEIAFLFYAEVDASISEHVSGLEAEGEDILVSAKPAQEVFDMMDAWDIQKATSLLALNWLRVNHLRLRCATSRCTAPSSPG